MNHLDPVPSDVPERGMSEGRVLADLLRTCARGGDAAFADLYDRTSARVYGLVLRVVRDPAQAEEVTQECFLEIWRTSSRFELARGSALAWMMTIAHRRAVDRVRAAESARQRETVYEERNRPVNHDSTAEVVQASFEARRVRSALAGLTPIQRQAVELAYLGGCTHTEVAVLLDLPLGTAKTRIRDGLIRLRDVLGVGGAR
ncbi:MAG: ECF RNA polymerase sigma factor SigK [Nocardioides sp.]|uniref:ECF RNA polymerase sigma factor SigK n=1 Tax=Nocardioides sp. TaxID=35761 RepID=UPI0039E30714